MNSACGSDATTNRTKSEPSRQIQRKSSIFSLSFRSRKARRAMVDKKCKELAIEGERLCKEGMWVEGIQKLEAAFKIGTTDMKTLSALYSQLGNAYFYLEDFSKSLEYHNRDLTLARTMGDKLGEAKASGNIGSALKAMGQYDESIACCRMQLDLARDLSDKVLESRALYNLGNVYHARGKHAATVGFASNHDQSSVEDFIRTSLEQATRHYEANLKLVRDQSDYQSQGRTIGNLGNTYYLLGNYKKAIKYHEERLCIAELLGDKVASRRAYSNLGNAQIYLGKYTSAAQYYMSALEVSMEMGDTGYEAQSCYSLGNTYTLMKNYHKAIEFHTRHLHYAISLGDRVGEGRAYWNLGNAHSALGDYKQGRHFCVKHLKLAEEMNDSVGIDTARQNLTELDTMLHLQDKYECPSPRLSSTSSNRHSGSFSWAMPLVWKKKVSKKASETSLRSETSSTSSFKLGHSPLESRAGSTSPTCSVSSTFHEESTLISGKKLHSSSTSKVEECTMDESFLDLISKSQSCRLDDQRSDLPSSMDHSSNRNSNTSQASSEEDDLFEMLCRLQGSRIEEQRCDMPRLPGTKATTSSQQRWDETDEDCLSSDELFELIFASQSSRINDQRSPDPKTITTRKHSTMPNEDFFNLIQHLQSTRIEDQRSPLPVLAN